MTALKVKRLGKDATPAERFMSKVHKDAGSGCWIWLGAKTGTYGWFGISGKKTGSKGTQAHRWSYENFIGPIPDGKQLDHLCHTNDPTCSGGEGCAHRLCVNPHHLEPVAPVDNVRRSRCSVPGRPEHPMLRKTHCRNGHEFNDENTVVVTRPDRDGRSERRCRACNRQSSRQTQRNRRSERNTTSARAGDQHLVGVAMRTSPHPQPSSPTAPPPPRR